MLLHNNAHNYPQSQWLNNSYFMDNRSKCRTYSLEDDSPKPYVAPVDRINAEDVFCGKDRQSHTHPGNQVFRSLILDNREEYQNATMREQKTRITTSIIERVHLNGGRFVKFDEDTSSWFEVNKAYAHDKVSHALRSAKDPRLRKTRKPRPTPVAAPTDAEVNYFQALLADQERIFEEAKRGAAL